MPFLPDLEMEFDPDGNKEQVAVIMKGQTYRDAGLQKSKFPYVEGPLYDKLCQFSRYKMRNEVRKMALNIAIANNDQNFKPTVEWLDNFMRRFCLSRKKMGFYSAKMLKVKGQAGQKFNQMSSPAPESFASSTPILGGDLTKANILDALGITDAILGDQTPEKPKTDQTDALNITDVIMGNQTQEKTKNETDICELSQIDPFADIPCQFDGKETNGDESPLKKVSKGSSVEIDDDSIVISSDKESSSNHLAVDEPDKAANDVGSHLTETDSQATVNFVDYQQELLQKVKKEKTGDKDENKTDKEEKKAEPVKKEKEESIKKEDKKANNKEENKESSKKEDKDLVEVDSSDSSEDEDMEVDKDKDEESKDSDSEDNSDESDSDVEEIDSDESDSDKQPDAKQEVVLLEEKLKLGDVTYTKAENKYFKKNYSSLQKRLEDKPIQCTACFDQINHREVAEIFSHPVLGVIICKKCKKFYGNGSFKTDSDGYDEYCRWCANGGDLLLCDFCLNGFCKKCIKRNLGRTAETMAMRAKSWTCYVCDLKPLTEVRAVHRMIISNLKNQAIAKDKLSRKGKKEMDTTNKFSALRLKRKEKSATAAKKEKKKKAVPEEEEEGGQSSSQEFLDAMKQLLAMCSEQVKGIEERKKTKKGPEAEKQAQRRLLRLIDGMEENLGCLKAMIGEGNTSTEKGETVEKDKDGKKEKKDEEEMEEGDTDGKAKDGKKDKKGKKGKDDEIDSEEEMEEGETDEVKDKEKEDDKVEKKNNKRRRSGSSVASLEGEDSSAQPAAKKRHVGEDKEKEDDKETPIKKKKKKTDDDDGTSNEESDAEDKKETPIKKKKKKTDDDETSNEGSDGDDDTASSKNPDGANEEMELTCDLNDTPEQDDLMEGDKSTSNDEKTPKKNEENCSKEKESTTAKRKGKEDAESESEDGEDEDKDKTSTKGDKSESPSKKKGLRRSGRSKKKEDKDSSPAEGSDAEPDEEKKKTKTDEQQNLLDKILASDSDDQDNEESTTTFAKPKPKKGSDNSEEETKSSEEKTKSKKGSKTEVKPSPLRFKTDKSSQNDDKEEDSVRKTKKEKKTDRKNKEAKKSLLDSDSDDSSVSDLVNEGIRKAKKIKQKMSRKQKHKSRPKSVTEALQKKQLKERKAFVKAEQLSETVRTQLDQVGFIDYTDYPELCDSPLFTDSDEDDDQELAAILNVKEIKSAKDVTEDDDDEDEDEDEEEESEDKEDKEERKKKKKSDKAKEEEEKKKKEGLMDISLDKDEEEEEADEEEKKKDDKEDDNDPLNAMNKMKKALLMSSDEEQDQDDEDDDDDDEDDDEKDDKKKKKKELLDDKIAQELEEKRRLKYEKKKELEKKKNENSEEEKEEEEESEEEIMKPKTRKKEMVSFKFSSSDEDSDDSDDESDKDSPRKARMFIDSDESSSDSSKKKKKKGSKGIFESLSSDGNYSDEEESEDEKKKEKKKSRKRIKRPSSSTEEEDAGDEEGGEEGADKETPSKKRHRRIIRDEDLLQSTKDATQEEQERRDRVKQKQAKYNKILEVDVEMDQSDTKKLVLDLDEETQKEVVTVHEKLVSYLKPHQVSGIRFMWDATIEDVGRLESGEKGGGCILAHCMGLGKTLQVIAFVHTLMTNDRLSQHMSRIMVCCPVNTVYNWVAEFNSWLKSGRLQSFDVIELISAKDLWTRAYRLEDWYKEGGVCIIGYDMFRNLSNATTKRYKGRMKEIFQKGLVSPGPDMMICDEGHILKNEKTVLSIAINKIKTRRRIVLTGTPLQNNLKEYHCMIQFVKPNLLGSRKEFMNRFVHPIEAGQCVDALPRDVKRMKRRAHILHNLLEGCVQRFDYSVLKPFLPPKFEYVVSIQMCDVQCKLYSYYLENLAQGGPKRMGSGLFVDFNNLSRIWSHPVVLYLAMKRRENEEPDDDEEEMDNFIDDSDSDMSSSDDERKKKKKKKKEEKEDKEEEPAKPPEPEVEENKETPGLSSSGKVRTDWWRRVLQDTCEGDYDEDDFLNRIEISGKLTVLFDILRECGSIGDKVLVFSQSILALDMIEEFLRMVDAGEISFPHEGEDKDEDDDIVQQFSHWKQGRDYLRLDGSISADIRKQQCKQFNNTVNERCRLFLISTRAGGVGINLVAANRVVIFDSSWNPSHDTQSIFRVYRFGQKKPCYIYRFVAQGTMEEKIYSRQVTKISTSLRVVDEHQIKRYFNMGELAELYQFTPADVEERETPAVPEDRLLAELLIRNKKWIVKYHEQESLLENQTGEELNEDERKAAWEDYENEKKGFVPPKAQGGVYNLGQMGHFPTSVPAFDVQQVVKSIYSNNPNMTSMQLQESVLLATQQVQRVHLQQYQKVQGIIYNLKNPMIAPEIMRQMPGTNQAELLASLERQVKVLEDNVQAENKVIHQMARLTPQSVSHNSMVAAGLARGSPASVSAAPSAQYVNRNYTVNPTSSLVNTNFKVVKPTGTMKADASTSGETENGTTKEKDPLDPAEVVTLE